jgi:hypothetical protein
MPENQNASEYVLVATVQPCFSSGKHSKIILSDGTFLGTFNDSAMLDYIKAKREHRPFFLQVVKRREKPTYPPPEPSEVVEETLKTGKPFSVRFQP